MVHFAELCVLGLKGEEVKPNNLHSEIQLERDPSAPKCLGELWSNKRVGGPDSDLDCAWGCRTKDQVRRLCLSGEHAALGSAIAVAHRHLSEPLLASPSFLRQNRMPWLVSRYHGTCSRQQDSRNRRSLHPGSTRPV